jgi:hypothetical protein
MSTRGEIIIGLSDEERKARRKESKKKYRESDKGKSKEQQYLQSPEVKIKEKELRDRPKVKARKHTPEYKARQKGRRDRPENKAKRDKIRYDMRLKVLQTYSKRLSNSSIPCCRCCGLNDTLGFLAVDHIIGRKQMDSEPELVKLGYSSKLGSVNLLKWIIEHNFPKGFQILCHNCNTAKGMKQNNNKCPLENKPH